MNFISFGAKEIGISSSSQQWSEQWRNSSCWEIQFDCISSYPSSLFISILCGGYFQPCENSRNFFLIRFGEEINTKLEGMVFSVVKRFFYYLFSSLSRETFEKAEHRTLGRKTFLLFLLLWTSFFACYDGWRCLASNAFSFKNKGLLRRRSICLTKRLTWFQNDSLITEYTYQHWHESRGKKTQKAENNKKKNWESCYVKSAEL